MARKLVCIVLTTFAVALSGCITEDSIRNALERTGERAVDDAADSTYDAARSKAAKAAEGGAGEKDGKAQPPAGDEAAKDAPAEKKE